MKEWVIGNNVRVVKRVKEKITGTPKVLPNNLKAIKKSFGYTDNSLAELLGVAPNYINAVLNERVSISGKSIITLMHKLNIPFDSIFTVNNVYKGDIEQEHFYMYMVKSTNVISNNDEAMPYIEEFVENVGLEYNNWSKIDVLAITKIKYRKKFYIDFPAKIQNFLGSELTQKYKESVESIDSEKYYKRDSNFYLIAIRVKCTVEGTINLNPLTKIDIDFANMFFKLPFKKVEQLKLVKGQYYIKDDMLYINDGNIYNIISKQGVYEGNSISMKDITVLKDDSIYINILSDKYHGNKFKLYRLLKGLTTKEMASMLGIEAETYSLIERGHQKMSITVMWKIEHVVGIFLDNILDIDFYYNEFCKSDK